MPSFLDLPHSLDGESKYTSLLIPSFLPLGDYTETRHGETRFDDFSIDETSPLHDYRIESLHEQTSPSEVFPFVIRRLAPLPNEIYWELLPHVFSGTSFEPCFRCPLDEDLQFAIRGELCPTFPSFPSRASQRSLSLSGLPLW